MVLSLGNEEREHHDHLKCGDIYRAAAAAATLVLRTKHVIDNKTVE